ncbi:MAG TPA: hypothetical protein IGR64_10525 [Leptolyngbyaceae cyanobacterium M65_K2018_010]|nr:hypothetical protein [Leptolyngbyaceae cyanobacterium M65_K2018_010]
MVQSPPRTNPFPGLRPFELDEEHLFFGREGQADELLRRLHRTRFLAVVGTSGSGKSSLVRAGLLPSLYSGFLPNASSGWRVAMLRPGSAPMANLAAALNAPDVFGVDPASDDAIIRTALTESTLRRGALGLVEVTQQARMEPYENLLVVVDQFEELFRFKEQAQQSNRNLEAEDEAAAFVKLLLGAVGQQQVPIFVVLTMRSDFLGDCAQFRDLPETLNDSQYLIPRLTREQLRSAIEGPVAVGGGTITPRLVNRLLNDTGDNPDQLPILQHALMRTWDHWEDQNTPQNAIDIPHYEAIGGMAEALSRHADQIYEGLRDDRSKTIAEILFRCLTDLGADNREIRRPTQLEEVCNVADAGLAEVVAVIEEFRAPRRSFLMPPAGVSLRGDTVIDISHESLMRNWQRLKGWVEEEAQAAQIYKRLAETAELHARGRAEYWRGAELVNGLAWLEEQQPNKAWAERYSPNFDEAVTFLEASAKAREAEEAEKERSRKREVNRLRTFLALLGGLSLLTGGAAVYAFNQQQEAKNQAQIALQREQDAEEQRAIASQQREAAEDLKQEADQQRGIALQRAREAEAAKAEAQEQQIAAETAREAETEQRQRAVEALRRAELGEAEANRQAEWAKKQTLTAQEERRKAAIQALNAAVQAKALTVENLLASGLTFKALLVAMELGQEIKETQQGSELIPANRLQSVSVLSKALFQEGFQEKNTFRGHTNSVNSVSLSPDGRILASASADGTVKLWEKNGRELQTLRGHTAGINSLSFSTDGQMLASASVDGTVKLWNLSGQELQTFQGHTAGVTGVSFSPDGQMLATASADGTVKLWDRRGRELQTLKGHSDPVWSVIFSPDGQMIASASSDHTAKLWDLSGREIQTLQGHKGTISSVVFSPDSQILVTASWDETLKLWDKNGRELRTFYGHNGSVNSAVFSPDGTKIASSDDKGKIKLWDANGNELQTLSGHSGTVYSVGFFREGKVLISGSADGTVKLWSIGGREPISLVSDSDSNPVRDLAFSQDGKALASANSDGTVKLWSYGREPQTLKGHSGNVSSVDFSRDGQVLVSGSFDGTIRLWDTSSGLELQVLEGHSGPVWAVEFSPSGEVIASAGFDRTIKLWDKNGREINSLAGHLNSVVNVEFSPDLNREIIVSTSADGTAKIWSQSGQELQTLSGHSGVVWDIAFSPDSQLLATASSDGTVRLWDNSGQELRTFFGHSAAIYGVNFGTDGQTVVSASADGTVKIWDLNGQMLQTLSADSAGFLSVSFAPNGLALAAAGSNGSIYLWDLNLGNLMAKSCDWLRDYMANPATPPDEKALCKGYLPFQSMNSAVPRPVQWVANLRGFLGQAFGTILP